MVCESCKCEGKVRPSKQWEVRLRDDITILLTPEVSPMSRQRTAEDWMYFKECLFSAQSPPYPGHYWQRIPAALNHRLLVSGRESWLHFVARFPGMLI